MIHDQIIKIGIANGRPLPDLAQPVGNPRVPPGELQWSHGLRQARKPRRHDKWDPPITPYDPYGPGPTVSAYAGDEAIDDRYRKR